MWERIASVAKKKGGMNSQLKWYINNIEHARNLENVDFISILFQSVPLTPSKTNFFDWTHSCKLFRQLFKL